jgi:polyisoprenoid-binding protein YceI
MTKQKYIWGTAVLVAIGINFGFHGASAETGPASSSEIKFLSKGSRFTPSIEGTTKDIQFQDFVWKEDGLTGKVQVSLLNLQTGMGLRDKHLREYLETEKYPHAVLDIKSFPVKEGTVEKEADLTLHGVTKKVLVKANWEKLPTDRDWKLSAAFDFELPDYNVETPSFKNITVGNRVSITMNSELQKPEAVHTIQAAPAVATKSTEKTAPKATTTK